jgi:hypothetical protein
LFDAARTQTAARARAAPADKGSGSRSSSSSSSRSAYGGKGSAALPHGSVSAAPARGPPLQRLRQSPPARSLGAFVDGRHFDGNFDGVRDPSGLGSPARSRSPRAERRFAGGGELVMAPPVALSPASRFYGVSASVLSSMR